MAYGLMIADDEPLVRYILRSIIPWQQEGFELLAEAEDGVSALSLMEEKTPDLLLLDIKMPGLTGLEIMRQARTVSPDTRIILVSGYADFEYAREVIRTEGAVDYLVKPVERDDLLRALALAKAQLTKRAPREENVDADWVDEMLTALRETSVRELHLQQLAGRFNMSASHLSALVKRHLGETFSGYVTRRRMERATELLKCTQMQVSQIAAQVGYRDPLYFMKAFKKCYGVSPGQYRKEPK